MGGFPSSADAGFQGNGPVVARQWPKIGVDGTSVAIASSGGGTRTYTAMLGYVRGLQELGLWSQARTLSTSSGSSWLAAILQTVPASVAPLQTLLGQQILPNNATMANLKSINTTGASGKWAGDRPAYANVTWLGIKALVWENWHDLWPYMVGKIFLAPYFPAGEMATDSPMAASAHAAEHQTTCGGNTGAKMAPIVVRVPTRAWLCNLVLLPPYDDKSKMHELATTVTAEVAQISGVDQARMLGGATGIDSFLLGSIKPSGGAVPSECDVSGAFTATRIAPYASLAKWLACSSAAFAADLVKYVPKASRPKGADAALRAHAAHVKRQQRVGGGGRHVYLPDSAIRKLSPQLLLWGTAGNELAFVGGDAGFMDNTGVGAAVGAGARRVLLLLNTETVFAPDFKHVNDIEFDLRNLFGVWKPDDWNPNDPDYTTKRGNIFAQAGLDLVTRKFKDSAGSAGPGKMGIVWSRTTATTVPNLYGAPVGVAVDLFVIHLSLASAWVEQLPAETKSKLGTDDFPKFPHYSTTFPNGLTGGPIDLTPAQVNLLSSYTHWVATQLAPQLSAFFAGRPAAYARARMTLPPPCGCCCNCN